MSGMYSIAVSCFGCEQPAAAAALRATNAIRAARPAARSRPLSPIATLNTENPDVDRAGRLENHEDATLVPVGSDLRDPKSKAIVRQIAVQDRLRQVRETAGQEKGRERHRPTDENAAFEGDRDEGRKRDHRLSAHENRPVERGGPNLERQSQRGPAQSHDER